MRERKNCSIISLDSGAVQKWGLQPHPSSMSDGLLLRAYCLHGALATAHTEKAVSLVLAEHA